jgi:ribosomal protein L37AE/L43A
MKAILYLLDRVLVPIIVGVLIPLFIGIGSRINTGNWFIWFNAIKPIVWISFLGFIAVWIIAIIIRKRKKLIDEMNCNYGPIIASIPAFGWIVIGTMEYAGVIWRIKAPAPAPWKYIGEDEINPYSIEAETPPRCPKCETELEQIHRFWGGYLWSCVSCGFKKKNKNSFYREDDRVTKIARREWEKNKFGGSSA